MQEIPKITETPIFIVVLMVILASAFVGAAVWYIFKVTKGNTLQQELISILKFCIIMIISAWAVDKVVGVRSNLLNDEESKTALSIVEGFMLTALGYLLRKTDEPKI